MKNIRDNLDFTQHLLQQYYGIIKPACYYTEKQIVIVFKFPIVSADIYKLYKLSIVPKKIQNIFIPPYPFIAINEKSFLYMETECPKFKNWYLCQLEGNQRIHTEPDCVQQLISHQVLKEYCKYTTVTLAKEAMEKLDNQHYVFSFPQVTKLQLACEREEFTSLQRSFLIIIPVKCYIKTPELTIQNYSDEVKGQPLKLMQIPFNPTNHIEIPTHLNLNSISLQELHSIQDKIIRENPFLLEKLNFHTIYHTTIPFYVFILSAGALKIVIGCHRYKLQKTRKPNKITDSSIIPSTSNDNIGEQLEEEGTSTPRKKMPATFYLNVLK